MKIHLFLLAQTIVGLALTAIQGQAQSIYEPYTFTTLAGVAPASGALTGSTARFGLPGIYMGLAADHVGNIYVGDYANNAIRKVTPTGVVTTFARGVTGNGVAVDAAGNLYVVDEYDPASVRKVTPSGTVTTLPSDFYIPAGAAVDSVGNVYVADRGDNAILKITPTGEMTTLAGPSVDGYDYFGKVDGMGGDARFSGPSAVTVDGAGNVYVADTGNAAIRKVTPAGLVTTLAGPAQFAADGAVGGSAVGLAVDNLGNVYLADTYNNTIRKVTPAGVVTTLAGLAGSFGFADGTGKDARFNYPAGLTMDDGGNIYVGDVGNSTIRKVTPTGVVTTLAGLAGSAGSTDGTGNAARFGGSWRWPTPKGVAVDNVGNVYVADKNAIRKITPSGAVTTLAGLTGTGGTTDGTGIGARFGSTSLGWDSPAGVAVDSEGSVYVTDNGTVRKITSAGVVTTLAGLAGAQGINDGTGTAARFGFQVAGVAVDSSGNLYVADQGNSAIRKVTPTGVVTTLAGLAGSPGSADGTATAARFNFPQGVAVDRAGNVYVADTENFTIRKVTPAGLVTTLAGLAGGIGTTDGTGTNALFGADYGGPTGVAVDSVGNVFVTVTGLTYTGGLYGDANVIRKVTPAGVVTTLAGLAGSVGFADGTGSDARFSGPFGVAVDSAGSLYVADSWNNTIRKGYPALLIVASGQNFGSDAASVSLKFPGPPGKSVVVEGSTDLVSWLPIWTNTPGGALKFSDPQSGVFSKRFYRARLP